MAAHRCRVICTSRLAGAAAIWHQGRSKYGISPPKAALPSLDAGWQTSSRAIHCESWKSCRFQKLSCPQQAWLCSFICCISVCFLTAVGATYILCLTRLGVPLHREKQKCAGPCSVVDLENVLCLTDLKVKG